MELINGNSQYCRCPLCGTERVKTAVFAPWISPVGRLVCNYGACAACLNTLQDTPEPLRPRLMDKVEQNLLEWYPQLREKLPRNYGLGHGAPT